MINPKITVTGDSNGIQVCRMSEDKFEGQCLGFSNVEEILQLKNACVEFLREDYIKSSQHIPERWTEEQLTKMRERPKIPPESIKSWVNRVRAISEDIGPWEALTQEELDDSKI